jgi:hypothetical protein
MNTIQTLSELSDDLILNAFKELGNRASFHFADDSGSEWNNGYEYQNQALEWFDSCPELQPKMREIAKKFLWSLNISRPLIDSVTK